MHNIHSIIEKNIIMISQNHLACIIILGIYVFNVCYSIFIGPIYHINTYLLFVGSIISMLETTLQIIKRYSDNTYLCAWLPVLYKEKWLSDIDESDEYNTLPWLICIDNGNIINHVESVF